jgi:hypothetical protein
MPQECRLHTSAQGLVKLCAEHLLSLFEDDKTCERRINFTEKIHFRPGNLHEHLVYHFSVKVRSFDVRDCLVTSLNGVNDTCQENASWETVGEAVSSFVCRPRCTLPLKTLLPLMTGFSGVCPRLTFSSIKLIMFAAFFRCSNVRFSALRP